MMRVMVMVMVMVGNAFVDTLAKADLLLLFMWGCAQKDETFSPQQGFITAAWKHYYG